MPTSSVPGSHTLKWMGYAFKDDLTQLFNARYLRARFEQESAGGALTLIVLDLDGFKEINDRFGHAMGDAVLRRVAWILRESVGVRGTVCRLGGDEFVCLLSGSDPAAPTEVTADFAQGLARYPGSLPMPGFSAGWATFPAEGVDLEGLIRSADARMYAHKRGKQGVIRYGDLPDPA